MPVELPLGPSRQRPAAIGVAFLLLSCGPEQGSSSTESGSSMGHEAGTSTSGEHRPTSTSAVTSGELTSTSAVTSGELTSTSSGEPILTAGESTSTTSDDTGSTTGVDTSCGDGVLDPGETCDDANLAALDGCEADCSSSIVQIETGIQRTCVLLVDGQLRCWGANNIGQLGLGHTNLIGDDPGELPPPIVPLGGKVLQFGLGLDFGCALIDGGVVRCWGANGGGQLGIGNAQTIGDEPGEMPPADTPVGGEAVQVAVGTTFACARLKNGELRCWGNNEGGELGYGHTQTLGWFPGQLPTPAVPIGGKAVNVSAGDGHSCAILEGGAVRCWGRNNFGQLGYGHVETLGDAPGELPPPDLDLGGPATDVLAGSLSTCAMLGGALHCWGAGLKGILGQGDEATIGNELNEMPPPAVPVGGPIVRLGGLATSTCALLEGGVIRCWGTNGGGELGYGHHESLGDQPGELPTPDVKLGGSAIHLSSKGTSTCAQLTAGPVRCWGTFYNGVALVQIGDDELPDSIPPVPVF